MLFFNSLLGYSVGRSKNWGSVLFPKSLLQYSFGRFENCMVLSYDVLDFACMVCTYSGPGTFLVCCQFIANFGLHLFPVFSIWY